MINKVKHYERARHYLRHASRQYRHNLEIDEYVFAFDHDETIKLVSDLIETIDIMSELLDNE